MACRKEIPTFAPASRNRPRTYLIRRDNFISRIRDERKKMLESRNSIAHLQHVGISALSATSEWHIISKQRRWYTVNNAKPLCYNNPSKPEALLPRGSPPHPPPSTLRVPVVSFNSPWLTSLLSRILNARLKHLRVGFCNIYNARIIGSY